MTRGPPLSPCVEDHIFNLDFGTYITFTVLEFTLLNDQAASNSVHQECVSDLTGVHAALQLASTDHGVCDLSVIHRLAVASRSVD